LGGLSPEKSPRGDGTAPNQKIPATLFQPYVQNLPRKISEASLAGYNHGKASERSSKDQVEWPHLRRCSGPSWCGPRGTLWDCCWSWGISGPPRAAAPATFPKWKTGTKWI